MNADLGMYMRNISDYIFHLRGIHKVGGGLMFQKSKKRRKVWKSYLEASYGPGNLLNREYWSQLLWDNSRLFNQLLLRSELGPFELQSIEKMNLLINPL